MHTEGPKTVYINVEEGKTGEVTAGDIIRDDEVEIVNPDLVLCTLTAKAPVYGVADRKGRWLLKCRKNKISIGR